MNKKIKLGWVGAGFIGQVAHLRNFSQNLHCQIHSLAELRPDLLESVSKRYSIEKKFLNYKDLFNEDLDAIVLIVRRYHTYHYAREILKQKIPLFTEKPMAANYKQAYELLKLSKKNKVSYMIGNMRAHDDGVKRAFNEFKKILNSEKLGKLISFKIFCNAGNDYVGIDNYITSKFPAPNNYIHDNAPYFLKKNDKYLFEKFLAFFSHDLNLINHFLGKPKSVFSSKINKDSGIVVLDYKNFFGSFEFNYLNQSIWQEGLIFNFEKGYLQIQLPPAFLKNQTATFKIYDDRNNEFKLSKPNNTWSFKNQANYFIDLIRKNKFDNSSASISSDDILLAEKIWEKS